MKTNWFTSKVHAYLWERAHRFIIQRNENSVNIEETEKKNFLCEKTWCPWKFSSESFRELKLTFFLSFPRMWHSRFTPSKHIASRRPLPSIFVTWAYSCSSSLKSNSRFSDSFSFFPRRRFFPPFPLFLGILLFYIYFEYNLTRAFSRKLIFKNKFRENETNFFTL